MLVCTSKYYRSLENHNDEKKIKDTNGRNLLLRPRIHEKKIIQCFVCSYQELRKVSLAEKA